LEVIPTGEMVDVFGGGGCPVVFRKERKMNDTVKPKERWFFKAELLVLVCLVCIWAVKSEILDIRSIKAGDLKQTIKLGNNNPDTHLFLANFYAESGRYPEAIESFKRLTLLEPNDAFWHLLLGNAYYDSNHPEEAIESYKAAIRLDRDCFDAHLSLGDVYYGSSRYAESIEHFKEAVRIRPDSTWAHTCLGLAYSDSGRCDDAVEAYNQLVTLKPDVADVAHLLIGNAYTASARYEEAEAAYKQAIGIDANMAAAHYRLGEVYLRMSNKHLALQQHEILKDLDKKLADKLFDLIH